MDTHRSSVSHEGQSRRVDLSEVPSLLGEILKIIPNEALAARACLANAVSILSGEERALAASRRRKLIVWQERRVLAHIEADLSGRLRCEELAATVNLSASHFNRLFKASFGVTPRAYIKQRRVELAQDLLASTATPIAIVAAQCGFADQPHLTRVFLQLVGQPPGVWRRQQAR